MGSPNSWVALQQYTAQVNTITPANVGSTNTFSVVINGKTVTFTAVTTTVASVCTGLAALLNASTIPEFKEITWTDNTTNILATARTPGTPFTQTSSAAGGTASLTTATATANQSPSDANDGLNWSTGSVPASGDTLYFGIVTTPCLWNLGSLSGTTVASITVARQYTGQIGLPDVNANGYTEYRPRYFAIGVSGSVIIGSGTQSTGAGSGRIRINVGSSAIPFTQYFSAQSLTTGLGAVNILGSAITAVYVYGGTMDIAANGTDTASVTLLEVSQAAPGSSTPTVRTGSGCTLTTVVNNGANLQTNSTMTTFTNVAGNTNIYAGAVTTLNANGGNVYDQSAGTVTTLNINGGNYDLSRATAAKTITNTIQMYSGASYNDPAYRVATPAFKLNGCLESQVSINIGPNRTLTVS